jgi:hypothetical protein
MAAGRQVSEVSAERGSKLDGVCYCPEVIAPETNMSENT